MNNERKHGTDISPTVYSVSSAKNLVAVRSRGTYFKRRSKGCILLIVILSFFMAFLLMLVVALSIFYVRLLEASNICVSADCLRIAASLKETMDVSVDPCDDFYGYVCGKWTEEHQTSELSDSWFSERTIKITRKVESLLRQNLTEGEVPWAVVQAKKLFDSCIDVESIDLLGLQPLLRTLEKVGLSQTPSCLSGKHGNVVETMAKVRRDLGKDVFFGADVLPDPKNKTRNVVCLDVVSLASALPSYNSEIEKRLRTVKKRRGKLEGVDEDADFRSSEKKYMFAVIREIVSNGTATNCSFKDEASDARDREIKRAVDALYRLNEKFYDILQLDKNGTLTDQDVAAEDYMLVAELQEITDQHVREMNSSIEPREIWRPYLEELLRDVEDLDLSKDLVLVPDLQYLKDVAYIMATTDDVYLESAIWWIVIDMVVPHSSKNLRQLWEEYMNDLIGYEPYQARSSYCADETTMVMGMAVAWLFVDPDFHEEKGMKVIEMLEDIRVAFSAIVSETNWMDARSKYVTVEKVRKMTYVIGHPSWLFEEGTLDYYYEGIDFKEGEFLENMLLIVSLRSVEELKILHEPNDSEYSIWAADPLDVNAVHSLMINHITVPEAILQFPFYDLGLEALNYGAIGTILGHELTHGFDNTGRRYDKDGNLHQWWSNRTITGYNERIECFVDHYGSYYVDEVEDYIDGELTLDENIADNGGLVEASLAYKRWTARHGVEPMLPGFTNLTHQQLLFLGFAHLWCARDSPESLQWGLDDPHCPGYLRVKGVLQNSAEFSEAWNCPVGSGMNPAGKCKVW